MHDLTSTAGIVAIAAGAVALIALAFAIGLAIRLRRIRADQRAVLGDGHQDLVAHAASLQSQFQALSEYVQDAAGRLDARMRVAEQRLDRAVAYRALIRYDAYGEMSGRQSTSIALLDATRSGIVLSSIHHRDQARLYAKEVHEGRGELELSPEEEEAIRLALEGGAGTSGGQGGTQSHVEGIQSHVGGTQPRLGGTQSHLGGTQSDQGPRAPKGSGRSAAT